MLMERTPIGKTGMYLIEHSPQEIASLYATSNIATELTKKALESGLEKDLNIAKAANGVLRAAVKLNISPIRAEEIIRTVEARGRS